MRKEERGKERDTATHLIKISDFTHKSCYYYSICIYSTSSTHGVHLAFFC